MVHLGSSWATGHTPRLMRWPVVVVVVLVHLQMVSLGMLLVVLMSTLLCRGHPMEIPTAVGATHVTIEIVLLTVGMMTSDHRGLLGMRVMQVGRFAVG